MREVDVQRATAASARSKRSKTPGRRRRSAGSASDSRPTAARAQALPGHGRLGEQRGAEGGRLGLLADGEGRRREVGPAPRCQTGLATAGPPASTDGHAPPRDGGESRSTREGRAGEPFEERPQDRGATPRPSGAPAASCGCPCRSPARARPRRSRSGWAARAVASCFGRLLFEAQQPAPVPVEVAGRQLTVEVEALPVDEPADADVLRAEAPLRQAIHDQAVGLRGAGRHVQLTAAAHPDAVGAAEVVVPGEDDRQRVRKTPSLGRRGAETAPRRRSRSGPGRAAPSRATRSGRRSPVARRRRGRRRIRCVTRASGRRRTGRHPRAGRRRSRSGS